MELVKHSEEEQARIDLDKTLTHASEVIDVRLDGDAEADRAAIMISAGMKSINERALAAGMVVLSTSISTSMVFGHVAGYEGRYLTVVVLCQWESREKLEEMNRRQFLATGGQGRRGA